MNINYKKIAFFIMSLLIIVFILIKLFLFSCPNTYYEDPIAILNKPCLDKERAFDTLKDYLSNNNFGLDDIKYTSIKFTTGNSIPAWELKLKDIAIDEKGNVYQKIKCI